MTLDHSKLVAHLETLLSPSKRPALSTSVIPNLIRSIDQIGRQLRNNQRVAVVGSSNAFGDEQLNVDLLAENTIRSEISTCSSIVTLSSEEDPKERPNHPPEKTAQSDKSEQYSIAFDPLDGSSIIAPNWTVGTIIGIWDGASALTTIPAEKQVASVLGVYGPRTTAIIAIRVPGTKATCFEVGLGRHGNLATCDIVCPDIELSPAPFTTRYFAPANLRAAAEDPRYLNLVTHYVKNKYTLRYSGGLVPDVVHALNKGHGIYISPVTSTSKAKLRRLYELAPIALIVECAGGSAIDPEDGQAILARPIDHCDARAGLVCGTREEVAFVKESLGLQ